LEAGRNGKRSIATRSQKQVEAAIAKGEARVKEYEGAAIRPEMRGTKNAKQGGKERVWN